MNGTLGDTTGIGCSILYQPSLKFDEIIMVSGIKMEYDELFKGSHKVARSSIQ